MAKFIPDTRIFTGKYNAEITKRLLRHEERLDRRCPRGGRTIVKRPRRTPARVPHRATRQRRTAGGTFQS